MAQAVTVFRWDDPGAPQIVDGRPSEYIDVFKKCLVDGYGTKTPLGWLIAEDDPNTPFLALVNDVSKGGSGGAITFSADNNAARSLVRFQSCAAFANRNGMTKIGPFNVFDSDRKGASFIKNWMLIGTQFAFYFFAFPDVSANRNNIGTYKSICFFCGDFLSFYNNDSARFTVASGKIDSTIFHWDSGLNGVLSYGSGKEKLKIYSLDGSEESVLHTLKSLVGEGWNSDASFNVQTPDITALSPVYILAGDGFLNSSKSNPYLNSVSMPFLRGTLPGAFISPQVGYGNVPMPHIKIINGVKYWQMPSSHAYASAVWINLEQW